MDTQSKLREFIAEQFMMGRNPEELTNTGSLLDLGIIDSTGVLELVGFLEETFNFEIDDEDLIPDNLDSIESLVKFVATKSA